MLIKQLSVFVENRTGRLAEITEILFKHNIDIRAFSIAETADYGIFRLIVNQPEKAVEALRANSITVSLTDVIAVEIPDKPGGLYRAVEVLTQAGVSIEYMYAFVSPKAGMAYVILRVEDYEKASEVLTEKGIRLLCGHELYSL